MPAEPESKREPWLAYAAFFALSVPLLYVLGLGPAARIAIAWPESAPVTLWLYTPVFELPRDCACQQALFWYGALWVPEGEGLIVPIYSTNPDTRARELIETSEPTRNIPEIWEKVWFLDLPESEDGQKCETPFRTRGGVI